MGRGLQQRLEHAAAQRLLVAVVLDSGQVCIHARACSKASSALGFVALASGKHQRRRIQNGFGIHINLSGAFIYENTKALHVKGWEKNLASGHRRGLDQHKCRANLNARNGKKPCNKLNTRSNT